jgi:hypothetical protein
LTLLAAFLVILARFRRDERGAGPLDEKAAPPSVPPQGSRHEFFMNSPLRGANLDLERVADYQRAFDLE